MPSAAQAKLARDTVKKHGSKTRWKQRLKGGARRAPAEFPKAALVRGIQVELEHTDDPLIAMEIAMDHLDEQLDYYQRLQEVEGNPRAATRERNAAMQHPTFNIPHGLAVAWAPDSRTYIVLAGDGPVAERPVIMHNPDPTELQSWLDTQTPQSNPEWKPEISVWDVYLNGKKIGDLSISDEVEHGTGPITEEEAHRWAVDKYRFTHGAGIGPALTVRRVNPHHGRKHNGAGVGAFLGSFVGAVLGAAIAGPFSALATLLSIAGGGAGGFYAADDDRKKRGAVGGAIGGTLGPFFAALGGWISGRHPDKKPTKHPRSLKDTLMANPEARLSYDEALALVEGGDIVTAAQWIGTVGPDPQEDPEMQRMTEAALRVLRSASAIEIEETVTILRLKNPQSQPEEVIVPVANPHAHKWWEAEGHCCEACAIEQPCSGEENCTLPTAQRNPKTGRKKKGRK